MRVFNKMTLREIIKNWLEDNGYTGLAGDGCGCEISYLMPCDEPDVDNCQAGYKIKCPGADKCPQGEQCPVEPDDTCLGWCVTTNKEFANVNKE